MKEKTAYKIAYKIARITLVVIVIIMMSIFLFYCVISIAKDIANYNNKILNECSNICSSNNLSYLKVVRTGSADATIICYCLSEKKEISTYIIGV